MSEDRDVDAPAGGFADGGREPSREEVKERATHISNILGDEYPEPGPDRDAGEDFPRPEYRGVEGGEGAPPRGGGYGTPGYDPRDGRSGDPEREEPSSGTSGAHSAPSPWWPDQRERRPERPQGSGAPEEWLGQGTAPAWGPAPHHEQPWPAPPRPQYGQYGGARDGDPGDWNSGAGRGGPRRSSFGRETNPAELPEVRQGGRPDASQVDDLGRSQVVRGYVERPRRGWRRAVYQATGGLLNPGPSAAERENFTLIKRISRRNEARCYRIAVVSIKGGTGKTTMSTLLAKTLALYRSDNVVAVDANPDAGTLADRITGQKDATFRDLLQDLDRIRDMSQLDYYLSRADYLRVLASEQDPAQGNEINSEDYLDVSRLLGRFFNVMVTDTGTGVMHPVMKGVLDSADGLVVVGAPTFDAGSRAAQTFDWLVKNGYADLAANAVTVLSFDRTSRDVAVEPIVAHFRSRCREVHELPYDPHLAIGAGVDWDQLQPGTQLACQRIAAGVADMFSSPLKSELRAPERYR